MAPLTDKITTVDELLAVEEVQNSIYLKECEMLYGPLNEETLWKYRERMRALHVYKPLNFNGKPFHFIHINPNDPKVIAFTADEKTAKQDKRTFIKPGRYLTQFTELDNEAIKKIITDYKIKYVPPEIMWADTPEKAVDVYEKGPNSCMKGKGWDDDNHPARVYAGPDTKLAYLEKVSGGYSARAVVRTDRNPPQYIRIYGDEALMQKAFKPLGIIQSTDGLLGVRFPVLPLKGNRVELLMPYLDGGYKFAELDKKEEFLKIINKSSAKNKHEIIQCENTSGTVYTPKAKTCHLCEKYYHIDDMLPNYSGGKVCEKCVRTKAMKTAKYRPSNTDEVIDIYVRPAHLDQTESFIFHEATELWYHRSALDLIDYVKCASTGEIIPKVEAVHDELFEESKEIYYKKEILLPLLKENGQVVHFHPSNHMYMEWRYDSIKQQFVSSYDNNLPTFQGYIDELLRQTKKVALLNEKDIITYHIIQEDLVASAALKGIIIPALYNANNYDYHIHWEYLNDG